jgi:hypothetical protein
MAAIAVAIIWLHRLGAGDLGAPPLSLDGAATWLDDHDIAVVAFALLRVLALGCGWYLLSVTAVGGAARYLHLPRITSLAERLTVPFARGLLGSMAALGVMAGPAAVPPHSPDVMVELSADQTSTTVGAETELTDQATLHLLSDVAEPGPPTSSAPAGVSTVPAAVAPIPDPDHQNTWVVQRGESFWSIAEDHLADVAGHDITERDVGSYWRQLIELNRSRLANPNDADLLFAGQVLELPAVASG